MFKKSLLITLILACLLPWGKVMAQTTVPYYQGFEGSTSLPAGWLNLAGTSTIQTVSSYVSEGANSLRMSGSTTDARIIALPEFTEDIKTLQITLSIKAGLSSYGNFVVGYLTDVNDASTFQPSRIYGAASYTDFHQEIIDLSTASSGARLAFKHEVTGTSQYAYWYVDDITVEKLGSCMKPTSIECTSSTDHEATLTWTAGAVGQDCFDLVVSKDALDDPSTSPYIRELRYLDALTCIVDGLETHTSYYAYIRAYCDAEHQSLWKKTTFTTACGAEDLPFSYGFETASDFECWTTNNCHNNTKITPGTTNSGSYKFTFNNDSGKNPQTIITPELNTTENGVSVEFWYRASTGSSTPKLKIAYSTTDNNVNSFDWTTNYAEVTASSTTYTKFSCNFPYNNIKYIAIQFDRNGSSYSIYIDDVKISEIPIVNLPYEYGFETVSDLNNKWTMENCYISGNSGTGLKTTTVHTGSYSFGFVHSNNYATQYLITPQINGATNGALISLYKKAPNTYCNIQIGYSTTDKAIGSFTFGDVISETNADFKYYESFCPAGTKYICIKHNGTNGQYTTLYLDDIKIIAIDKVFNGDGEDWDFLTNWTPVGLPEITDNIFINSTCIIDNDDVATANKIDLGPNGSLTIEDGGQLFCNNNVTATVEKNIIGHENNLGGGWNFIASPVTENVNPSVAGLITEDDAENNPTYDLFRFNQDAVGAEWQNYRIHTDGFNLVNGQGCLYANNGTVELTFAGTLNNTDGEVPLTYISGKSLAGWNLVGNPFPCNAYLSGGFYAIDGPGQPVTVRMNTTPIAPCTGAMVHVSEEQSITFSKTAPSSANNGNLQMTVAQQANNTRGASTGSMTLLDNAIVSFNESDLLEKFVFDVDNAKLYVPQNGKDYAIAFSEGQGEMPVNFRAAENGNYTLTVNPEGVEMNYLHLIDNMTGMDVDLLQTPSYSFEATPNDYESRFRLVFASGSVFGDEDGANASFAFCSNGNWIINNAGEATLQVIDLNGRILSSERVNGSVSKAINGTAGVYMLRLINGENVKVQKVVVR